MARFMTLIYGAAIYALFLGTFLYAIGFVGDFGVPKSINSGEEIAWPAALAINVFLLSLFAVQHSVMARPAFKRWWTRFVPHSIERSTYVLFTCFVLIFLYWQWRPIRTLVWSVTDTSIVLAIDAIFWLGWALVLISTFLISHFELFGLKQVVARFANRRLPEATFHTPLFYRYVRHPLYLGFLFAFWATPRMTVGRLVFAAATTGYILIAIQFEERDLIAQFGERYRRYRAEVGMLLPRLRRVAPVIRPVGKSG